MSKTIKRCLGALEKPKRVFYLRRISSMSSVFLLPRHVQISNDNVTWWPELQWCHHWWPCNSRDLSSHLSNRRRVRTQWWPHRGIFARWWCGAGVAECWSYSERLLRQEQGWIFCKHQKIKLTVKLIKHCNQIFCCAKVKCFLLLLRWKTRNLSFTGSNFLF